jgi:hypothetical protein
MSGRALPSGEQASTAAGWACEYLAPSPPLSHSLFLPQIPFSLLKLPFGCTVHCRQASRRALPPGERARRRALVPASFPPSLSLSFSLPQIPFFLLNPSLSLVVQDLQIVGTKEEEEQEIFRRLRDKVNPSLSWFFRWWFSGHHLSGPGVRFVELHC